MDVLEPIIGLVGEAAAEMLGEVCLELGTGLIAGLFVPEDPAVVSEFEDSARAQSASWLDNQEGTESLVMEQDVNGAFVWLKLSTPKPTTDN
jgi:hypothetical protein